MKGTEEELQRMSDEIRKQAEEMKQAFADLERSMKGWNKWIRPTPEALLKEGHKWQGWYAWRPVKDIHGRWHWLTDVYRILGNTYMDHEDRSWYHYGTVFDVLKAPE